MAGAGRGCRLVFFSSRRRHTRFDCDWSSDVCSSDLSERVLLATDPDREGEAIAWHVASQLSNGGKVRRVLFHEITKDAVAHALAHPLDIDQRKVDAQQARRVLDRLVGYKTSPLLWKSIKTGLSAGRVQTVA